MTSLAPTVSSPQAVDQFRPDDGRSVFDQFGGLVDAAWFISRNGTVRPAVRVSQDIALAVGGALWILRKGGVLVLDPASAIVVAVQRESFAARYRRSFSDGTAIVPQTAEPPVQGRGLMEANVSVQQDLQRIMSASGPKSWWNWKRLRADRARFDTRSHELSLHLRDLKALQA